MLRNLALKVEVAFLDANLFVDKCAMLSKEMRDGGSSSFVSEDHKIRLWEWTRENYFSFGSILFFLCLWFGLRYLVSDLTVVGPGELEASDSHQELTYPWSRLVRVAHLPFASLLPGIVKCSGIGQKRGNTSPQISSMFPLLPHPPLPFLTEKSKAGALQDKEGQHVAHHFRHQKVLNGPWQSLR